MRLRALILVLTSAVSDMNRYRVVILIVGMLALAGTATATAPGANGRLLIQGDGGFISSVDPVTGAITPIAPACTAGYQDPAGTADGRVAVVSSGGPSCGGTGLVVLDAFGTPVANLGNGLNGGYLKSPSWSPDGSLIAFEDHKPNGDSSISVIGSHGTNAHIVIPGPGAFSPTWSPDGTRIAFSQLVSGQYQHVIAYVNADGTGPVVNLTAGQYPTWSPDGTQIAFVDGFWSLFKINVNGTGRTLLPTDQGGAFDRPTWSPDGTKIAWGPVGEGGIVLVDPSGSTAPVQLTPNDSDYSSDWTSFMAPTMPSLAINDVNLPEGNSGVTPFTFTVTLSAASSHTVMVDYQTSDGTARSCEDYQLTNGTLTFLPGGPLSQTVTVDVFGDTLNEADETFFVTLLNPLNATIGRGQGVGTIINDDAPPSLSIDASNLVTQGNDVFVPVRLSAESGQTVTVNYSTADGTATVADPDYVATSGTLTFNPRVCRLAGDTVQSIRVPAIGDPFNAPPETFFINLTSPVNATIAGSQAVVTIYNIHGNTSQIGFNTPPVQPIDPTSGGKPVSMTFVNVVEPGDTTLTSNAGCASPPANFQVGNPPVCYDLKTTALFDGGVHVCVSYKGINFFGPPQLFHYEGGMWKDVTSSVDTVNQIVCGDVTSLSPFALFEPNQPPVAKCHNVTRSAGPSCNAVVTAADVNDGSFDPDGDAIAFNLSPAGPFGAGTTRVVLTVTDSKGASRQCNATVTVVDDTPPAITCPADITVGNTPGSCSANVTITPPLVTDNCSTPTVTATRSDAQSLNAAYPVGTTVITWVARDAARNASSCTQRVIVKDTEPPQLNVPGPITAEFADKSGAPVSYVVTSSDNCPGVTQTCAPSSGSTFPIGTTTVTCTATDLARNSTVKTFAVVVLGAMGVKQDALADLSAFRSTVTGDDSLEHLDDAIRALKASLDPKLWVDQTHLQAHGGEQVFEREKESVESLSESSGDEAPRALLPTPVQDAIMRMVKADRLLAEIAIDQAIATHASAETIAEAQRELARGDSAIAAGKFAQAIERYGEAWKRVRETAPGGGDD